MQAREETLISPPLLAGIFLDPEFQVLLTDAQRDFAKIELQAVHKRIVLLDSQKSIIDLEALAENEENESDSFTNLSHMQRMLMSKQKKKSGNSMSTSSRTSQAIKLINSFDHYQYTKVDDIFKFWETHDSNAVSTSKSGSFRPHHSGFGGKIV